MSVDLDALRPVYEAWFDKYDPDGEWRAALDAVRAAEQALEDAKHVADTVRYDVYRRMMELGPYPDQRYAL